MSDKFRAADQVLYILTGETLTLATDEENGDVYPLGGQEPIGQASDFILVRAATDVERMRQLQMSLGAKIPNAPGTTARRQYLESAPLSTMELLRQETQVDKTLTLVDLLIEEREACARVCDAFVDECKELMGMHGASEDKVLRGEMIIAMELAHSIRTRDFNAL